MQNFGRGMWRRISDHDKQQQATEFQTNRLIHYFHTQKQRAINAYSKIAISNEKTQVKEEITNEKTQVKEEITNEKTQVKEEISINEVLDNYVFVETIDQEIIISDPVISEPIIPVGESTVDVTKSVIPITEPIVDVTEPIIPVTEPIIPVSAPVTVSKSNAKKKKKTK